MRNIGDKVWVPMARIEQIEKTCPDCLGTARWHCTLPSGEEFDVECPRCYPGGYLPSTGKVSEELSFVARAIKANITGLRVNSDGVEYTVTGGLLFRDERDVCDTEADAVARCAVKSKEYVDSQNAELARQAKSKGRPRKNEDGTRAASGDFGGSAIVYAHSQIRRAFDDAIRWADFAMRKGVELNLLGLLNDRLNKKVTQ